MMADETQAQVAERLVADGLTWPEIWAAVQRLAVERGEWAGYPQPIQDAPVIIEPRHPAHATMNGATLNGLPEARICTDDEAREDFLIRNEWYSHARRANVMLYQEGRGRVKVLVVPVEPAARRLELTLRTFEPVAAHVWPIAAEFKALAKLSTLITEYLWQMYVLTGQFLETSPRSGVTYVFRRLRPTLALRPDPATGTMRCLAALCLHPIAFYAGTYAGVMVPTDDLLAHLLLMRGDEHRFWRQANQHPIETPEAGV